MPFSTAWLRLGQDLLAQCRCRRRDGDGLEARGRRRQHVDGARSCFAAKRAVSSWHTAALAWFRWSRTTTALAPKLAPRHACPTNSSEDVNEKDRIRIPRSRARRRRRDGKPQTSDFWLVEMEVLFRKDEQEGRRGRAGRWEIGELPKHGLKGHGGTAGSAGTRLFPLGSSARGPGNEHCRRVCVRGLCTLQYPERLDNMIICKFTLCINTVCCTVFRSVRRYGDV
jgi:hypothetical protein